MTVMRMKKNVKMVDMFRGGGGSQIEFGTENVLDEYPETFSISLPSLPTCIRSIQLLSQQYIL